MTDEAGPLTTPDQVTRLLARLTGPGTTFRVGRIEAGWLCQPIPGTQQRADGRSTGMASLVADAETGEVFLYPSWPGPMVAQDFTEAKRLGGPPSARRIHPPAVRVELTRTAQTGETIDYLLTVRDLRTGTERELPLSIDTASRTYRPTETAATQSVSWIMWHRDRTETWPERGTVAY